MSQFMHAPPSTSLWWYVTYPPIFEEKVWSWLWYTLTNPDYCWLYWYKLGWQQIRLPLHFGTLYLCWRQSSYLDEKKGTVVAHTSAEAEHRAMARSTSTMPWFCSFLHNMDTDVWIARHMHGDSQEPLFFLLTTQSSISRPNTSKLTVISFVITSWRSTLVLPLCSWRQNRRHFKATTCTPVLYLSGIQAGHVLFFLIY